MNICEYAELAMRTQAIKENKHDMLHHGIFGLSSECGEIVELVLDALVDEKEIDIDKWNSNRIDRMMSEVGDALWFIIEILKSLDIDYNRIIDNSNDSPCDHRVFDDKNKTLLADVMDISAVAGYISGRLQKIYQGRELDIDTVVRSVTSIFALLVDIVNILDPNMNIYTVMEHNIYKLKARFPQGFDADLDAHRKEGDL